MKKMPVFLPARSLENQQGTPFLSRNQRFEIAPSILAADFSSLDREISRAIRNRCRWFHLDIMDGHFVPNISFGPHVVSCIRKSFPGIFLDAHLMLEFPFKILPAFVKAGANLITIHPEACQDALRAVRNIHSAGVYAGLSIKPRTSLKILESALKEVDVIMIMSVEPGFYGQDLIPYTLNKVRDLSLKKHREKYRFTIQIDGGINEKTAPLALAAGAEVFVAGSAVFQNGKIAENIKNLRRSLENAS
jgi:ribulose-phosphate 3-epimerase